jgi:DNA-binding CsgD family transcriptional regulator
VLHLVLALYVVSFAMGMAIVALSMLAYARFSAMAFRQLAAVTAASLLIMLVNLLKVYDEVVSADLGAGLQPLYVIFTAVGFALIGYAAPLLAFRVVGRKVVASRSAIGIALAAALMAAGIWKELRPGHASTFVTVAAIVAILTFVLVILGTGIDGIENTRIRSLVRSSLFILPPLLFLMIVQAGVSLIPSVPQFVQESSFSTLLSLLVMDTLLFVYALRYLFRQDAAPACILSDQFISKFNISPRECEIISMMVQGHNNRLIAEKLFISAMTVKNHVYHIYQKTSATNKVQLMNLINSLK